MVPGTGDTAVIPHVYEEHGLDFPAAAARACSRSRSGIEHRERLVLARDRIGKKPLHYVSLPDGSLAFASELKALLLLPGLGASCHPEALDAYLALQYVPGIETGVAGIRRLAPGHVLVWEDGEIRTQRYWELEPEPRELSDDEWLELVRRTVRDAVRRRLVSDVPLGALLSGGIDSTIVVGLMAEASTQPVRTFTVGVDDQRYDERSTARIAASAFGTKHEELLVEPDPVELVSQLTSFLDEPLGDEADPADVPDLAGRAPPRHGRAHRGRRRRVLRRVRALRRDADGRARRRRSSPAEPRRPSSPNAPCGPAAPALDPVSRRTPARGRGAAGAANATAR